MTDAVQIERTSLSPATQTASEGGDPANSPSADPSGAASAAGQHQTEEEKRAAAELLVDPPELVDDAAVEAKPATPAAGAPKDATEEARIDRLARLAAERITAHRAKQADKAARSEKAAKAEIAREAERLRVAEREKELLAEREFARRNPLQFARRNGVTTEEMMADVMGKEKLTPEQEAEQQRASLMEAMREEILALKQREAERVQQAQRASYQQELETRAQKTMEVLDKRAEEFEFIADMPAIMVAAEVQTIRAKEDQANAARVKRGLDPYDRLTHTEILLYLDKMVKPAVEQSRQQKADRLARKTQSPNTTTPAAKTQAAPSPAPGKTAKAGTRTLSASLSASGPSLPPDYESLSEAAKAAHWQRELERLGGA